jgi:hypothetical protein
MLCKDDEDEMQRQREEDWSSESHSWGTLIYT